MRWLRTVQGRFIRRTGDESGATIVFIAVILVGLLAMTAFVIDFGRIWQERRELQVGATAGALAIAEDCAWGMCPSDEVANAEIYADANATDGAAKVEYVEFVDQSVYVGTSTESADGGNSLGMLFARIVNFDQISVGADAAVEWGNPLEAATIPLIISDCEWRSDAAGWPGSNPDLPKPNEISGVQMVTITFHDPSGTNECDALPGHDTDLDGKLPGGFGWLDTNGNCVVTVGEGDLVSNDPGSSPSTGCSSSGFEDLLGEVVLIPYFSDEDGINGKGAKGEYLIEAHGAFLVSGYNFGGQYREYDPGLTDAVPCGGPVRCLSGWFVKNVSHDGGAGGLGGQDRGAIVIRLIG